ncbi:hybrid sensor histidine kinase/response regulator [Aerosakkonemataceae cyanobacterium BLCC-F154]|uniref:histidine kinase n=1 Tax=Floridaenema fluviatile BLCC-F154 TaxID=3153640 RepID=A0ABV4YKT3_9CYAN
MNFDKIDIFKADILIVDDSPDNLRVLSTHLNHHGYKVRCVRSGAMALVGAQTTPPDLILLDIKMPEMDGYETCQQMKKNPQLCHIPIIFLSALDDPIDKVKAFEVGGEDYITKPFAIEEVLARVKHQLTIGKLQKELMQKNERLQQEIYEHQRTEAALRDAKEVAEAANYSKSEFLARMSHELRTPLNAILGFTELMQDSTSLTNEHQEYIKTIHRSGRHLLKLINNILMITQAENRHISLNEEDFDLYSLLSQVETYWQFKAEYENIQFIVDHSSKLPRYIHADKSKLLHILNNLLENSLKFTPQGYINFRVYADTITANAEQEVTVEEAILIKHKIALYFELEDSGMGISENELSSLFEVFSQIDVGGKSNQGIGLGLPITRQLIQRMGGDIAISSKSEQGTTVSFFIKVDLAEKNDSDELVENPGEFTEDFLDAVSFQLSLETITPDMLQAIMPTQWVKAIHLAAIKGFDRQILQLIQEIPSSHSTLAETLKYWTNNFWFDRIVDLTQPLLNLPHSN